MARHFAPTGEPALSLSKGGAPHFGMTLVEVLVVIGIMAVLTAMIVPVFATMQQRHQVSVCASNLKTIGQAILMYRADYLGFPPDRTEWWSHSDNQHGLGLSQLYYAYWANQITPVRPDGDADVDGDGNSDVNWTASGSPHYAQVNDAITQPQGEQMADIAPAPQGAVRSNSTGKVTITTKDAHGFDDGDTVLVAGVGPPGGTDFNGEFTNIDVTSSTTFTYSQPGPDQPGGGGTAQDLTKITTVSAKHAENGEVEAFAMGSVSGVGAVTGVEVWVYAQAVGAGSAQVEIYLPGATPAWQRAQTLHPDESYSWKRLTWGGEWTQANLDGLVVKFTAGTPGTGDEIYAAAVYADVAWSKTGIIVAAGDYLKGVRALHCPMAPASKPPDLNNISAWPLMGGYNVYDWNYIRDRWTNADERYNTWPQQGLRNLKQPFPPDNTVVTWCPMHRASPPADEDSLGDIRSRDHDLVLWVDGSVSTFALTPARFDQYKAEQP